MFVIANDCATIVNLNNVETIEFGTDENDEGNTIYRIVARMENDDFNVLYECEDKKELDHATSCLMNAIREGKKIHHMDEWKVTDEEEKEDED